MPTGAKDPTGRQQTTGSDENKQAWAVFEQWEKPCLTAFGEKDNIMAGADRIWHERCPGCAGQAHCIIKSAGHFLQDGGHRELTEVVLAFVRANPQPVSPKL